MCACKPPFNDQGYMSANSIVNFSYNCKLLPPPVYTNTYILKKIKKQNYVRMEMIIIIMVNFRYDFHIHPWGPRQLGPYAGWLAPIFLKRRKKKSVRLLSFFIHNVLFNSDRLDLDETCGISWLKAAKFIHG